MGPTELRIAFIEILRKEDYPNTISGLVFDISLFCLDKNFVTGENIVNNFDYERYKREKHPGSKFVEKYWTEISSIFWEFIACGTIAPGYGPDVHGNELSKFRITEYGMAWLRSEKRPIPEDTEGYIQFLKESIKNIDRVVIEYVSEAIKTFNRNYNFSSAVMLGAASEKLIYLLADELKDFPIDKKLRNDISTGFLKKRGLKFLEEAISSAIDEIIKNTEIPYDIHEGSNHYLSALFDAIRIQRNDAVHPKKGEISKSQLRLLLLSFPHVCKKSYDLLNWLKANNQ